MSGPCLPLPPPLRGSDRGSFAEQTVRDRLPSIVQRVIDDALFAPGVQQRLAALRDEITTGVITPLDDPGAPDLAAWAAHVAPYVGQTWFDVPWLLAEIYLWRRVLAASGYFQDEAPGAGVDPYAAQKEAALAEELPRMRRFAARLGRASLPELLSFALWGNQADISVFPTGGEQPTHTNAAAEADHLLVDHSGRVVDHIAARLGARVDLILDNAGLELFGDLCLADGLLGRFGATTVRLHVKGHPFFVSDAMGSDVIRLRRQLAGDTPALQALATRLQGYFATGRLQLATHPAWTLPLSYWDLPADLQQDLRRADLLISKGDANYRRWLGDRHWAPTDSLDAILCYAPAPLLLLRTLKSEVVAGLAPATIAARAGDTGWQTAGRYAVAQMVLNGA
jgi:hypothetical protein